MAQLTLSVSNEVNALRSTREASDRYTADALQRSADIVSQLAAKVAALEAASGSSTTSDSLVTRYGVPFTY